MSLMVKTMVGAADDDEPLDPELAARLRDTFAAIVPKLDLPELARFQASLDASLAELAPKFDMAALVHTFNMAELAPKFDMAALVPTLHDAIAAAERFLVETDPQARTPRPTPATRQSRWSRQSHQPQVRKPR